MSKSETIIASTKSTRAPNFQHSAKSRLVRVPDWPRLPAELQLYKTSRVMTDSCGFVYLTHRGEDPLICLNPDGSLHMVIGKDVLTKSAYYYQGSPDAPKEFIEEAFCLHGLCIDPWGNVWVTDFARHLVMRFDQVGQLTLVLGVDGQGGCDADHFNQPTDIWVASSGEIFVADGYVNSRMVKFNKDGKFIKDWGLRGTDAGQFHTPHVIASGPEGNLYVSDRENDRIQIFDQDGQWLGMWSGLHSVDGLCVAPNGTLYGSSGIDHAIIEFGLGGQSKQVWADAAKGDYPDRNLTDFPESDYPHGIWLDEEGFMYIAETTVDPRGSRVLKFRVEQDRSESEEQGRRSRPS